MKKTIKITCWTAASLLVVCAIIFHHSFLTYLAKGVLQTYSVAVWGKPLHYESLSLKDYKIVVEKPKIENETFFSAERLTLDFNIRLVKQLIKIGVDLDQPHWHFSDASDSSLEKWTRLLNQEGSWIKANPHLHFKKGTLSWALDGTIHQLNFDLKANSKEGGFVRLFFDSPEIKNSSLIVQTCNGSEGLELDCRCQNINCPSLAALAQFFGLDSSPWQITSGSLQGTIKAVFPKLNKPYFQGELIAENLAFFRRGTPLKGKIEKAKLDLEKNSKGYEPQANFLTTMGKLEILKGGSLSYHSPVQAWDIHQIIGIVQVSESENILVDLQAKGGNYHYPSRWKMRGGVNLNGKDSPHIDLELQCHSNDGNDGKIHFKMNAFSNNGRHAEVECAKLTYAECGFLQTLLATQWPQFNEILLEEGRFNARIEADMISEEELEVHVKEFEAFHLSSKFKPWNLSCSFSKIKGNGKVNFGVPDFWSSLDAEVYLENGKGAFEDLPPPLPIKDIQAHVCVRKGHVVDNSVATLQVAGLKGKMDIEWGDQKQLLTFKLDGKARDLSNFFPLEVQAALENHFPDNHLLVLANIRRSNQQVELGGTLHIQRDRDREVRDLVHFGCELKSIKEGKDSKLIPVGWFHAQNLPLEKYLSPFIFRNKAIVLSGEGEFKGSFDDHLLSIKYDGENIKLENEKFRLSIPSLHSSVPGQLTGSHHLNLSTHQYQGTLPIHSASYLERNSGLQFHDIQGVVHFTNGIVDIKPIEASCEGVYFGGSLNLDYRDPAPGAFDVAISCPSLNGKVSQIQQLLAHFNHSSLLFQVPLEGDVSGKEKGLELKFNFSLDDYQLQSSMKGMLNEGSVSFDETDIALKGIDLDISYDHQRQLLEFTDMQGTLLIGKPRRVEEYLLTGHHIHIYSLSQPDIDLDIAVKDRDYELFRVVGHTRDEEEGVKGFYLNPRLSHFSCIYPTSWNCKIGEEAEVEKLEFQSSFELSDLIKDLKRFRQTGLFFISHSFIDKILQFQPLKGEGTLGLEYQPNRGLFFQLKGAHVKYNDEEEHNGLLKGSKQDKKWVIDQIQWDEWSAYAELMQMEHQWRIPFLGLKIGDALLLGMDGDLLPEEASLKGRLRFCQIDLSKLDLFNSLKPLVAKWWPRGTLSATGEIEWHSSTLKPLDGFRAQLVTDISNFSLRNYPLQLSHPFKVDTSSAQSIFFKDVELDINGETHIVLNNLEYGMTKQSIQSLEGGFQIPHYQLGTFSETFHHYFPELFDECLKEVVASLKEEDQLRGTLALEGGGLPEESLKLTLQDGLYTYRKRQYDLKQFQLEIKKEKLQFSTLIKEERLPFQVVGEVAWPSCHRGKCQLMSFNGSPPLFIDWEKRLDGQGTIQSINGEFCGCKFALKRGETHEETSEWAALEGKVSIDFNRLSPLLSPNTAEAIEKLKIGSLYTLEGGFWINPERGTTFYESVSFKGKFQSKEGVLKGYQMKTFTSDLQYVPGRFDLLNLEIEDQAGSVKAPNGVIALDDDEQHWVFSFPKVTVKNFRPNALRETESSGQGNPKLKSLVFKKIDFQDMKGNIDEIPTWQAQGSLQFLNTSRKNALQTLFAIPAEIILRLGLDPQVLNPVAGTVFFNLQGDRFYLKRFKDVFSEGRGSKFYLIGPDPSWIDFDGNLSMNIWMKQYNLIFKITELFTVSIQGNIKKPRYALQKQSNVSKKGGKKNLVPKSLSKQIGNKKKGLVYKMERGTLSNTKYQEP